MSLINLLDELLPGRTDAEDAALTPSGRAVEVAEKRRTSEQQKSLPGTDCGRLGRGERVNALQLSVDAAHAELRAIVGQLEAARELQLPNDATGIDLGTGDLTSEDQRYPVVCRSGGQLVSLGGCSKLGPAQARVQWFQGRARSRSVVAATSV